MPELPEVETVRRDLAGELAGRSVLEVRIHHDDIVMDAVSPSEFRSRLRGRGIESVERRAKYLLLRVSGGAVLQVQLRMTGRFVLGRALPDTREFAHIAAEFDLDDGRTLYYDDVRRLGGFRLMSQDRWAAASRELGPEPLEEGFRPTDLAAALDDSRAPVKNCLLDQRRVAGVGNIYASETLHDAGVDPRRPARQLEDEEIRRVHASLRSVLAEALEHAGTTLRDFRAPDGRSGDFQARLRVYGREEEPCRRCGSPVRRIVQAGRSTYFCSTCQR